MNDAHISANTAAIRRTRPGITVATLAGVVLFMTACSGLNRAQSKRADDQQPSSSLREANRFEFIAPHMGMQARIVLYAEDRAHAQAAADAAFAEIGRLDQILSDWREDSETAKVNAAAGEEAVIVSGDFMRILRSSLEISRLSDGAFDITVGPLTTLWSETKSQQRQPSAEQIARARALVDWRKIHLDEENHSVRLARAGMKLDFGGIGKGYAADRALDVLRERGFHRAMVAIAGDIRLGDAPPHATGWAIAIHDRLPPDAPALQLANCGISTSGDAEQSLSIDGQTHSHIINPRAGLGLTERIAVTVIAPDATAADALATAVSVMGGDRGLVMIEKIEGAKARVVTIRNAHAHMRLSKHFPD